jgi:hypothetical protein
MKSNQSFSYIFLFAALLFLVSCEVEPTPTETKKHLFHPPPQQVILLGSVMKVDDGILILVQNGPIKEIPTIIIPANDSAGTVVKKAYQAKTDTQYQSSLQPWVKLSGTFLREDSISPIFKYNYVVLLDQGSEQQQVEEMEE